MSTFMHRYLIVIGILLAVAPFVGLMAVSWLVALLLLISGAEMLLLVWGLRSAGKVRNGDKEP